MAFREKNNIVWGEKFCSSFAEGELSEVCIREAGFGLIEVAKLKEEVVSVFVWLNGASGLKSGVDFGDFGKRDPL